MKKTNNNILEQLFKNTEKQNDRVVTKHAISIHEFYLVGEIESAEEYVQWFDTIRHAGQNDIVKIYINSGGGDLFTAIQFMRVLSETEATVIISVEGVCASAATMIMLAGDNFEVSPHSVFMFHNYSSGVIGKGGEMFDQLQYERVWSEKLLRETYAEFLTEKEITSILDNKDIWMDGDEVVKRLKKKVEKFQKNLKEEAKAVEVLAEEANVQTRTRPAKPAKLKNKKKLTMAYY